MAIVRDVVVHVGFDVLHAVVHGVLHQIFAAARAQHSLAADELAGPHRAHHRLLNLPSALTELHVRFPSQRLGAWRPGRLLDQRARETAV